MCTLVFFGLNRVYNSYSFGGKNISLKIRHEYLNVSTISIASCNRCNLQFDNNENVTEKYVLYN